MKQIVFSLVTSLCCTCVALAQKMPDYGLNRVHIYKPKETLLFNVLPVNGKPAAEALKTYYWYSADAIHESQGGYSGKLLNGWYQAFYLNKNLKEEGNFREGLKDGDWKTWYESGRLNGVTRFHNGVRSGQFTTYHEDGSLATSGQYHRDMFDGGIKTYHGNDSISTTYYNNGKVAIPPRSIWKRINIIKKRNKPTNSKPVQP